MRYEVIELVGALIDTHSIDPGVFQALTEHHMLHATFKIQ